MITAEGIEGAAYVGDYQPVNLYAGAHKVAGWHSQTVSGEGAVSLDGAYNVPPDALVIEGKCEQTVGVWGTNLITNGDFSNGTNGWLTASSSISASGNELSVLARATAGQAKSANCAMTNGHKYYFRAEVKATTDLAKISVSGIGPKAHSGSGNYESLSSAFLWGASTGPWPFRINDYRMDGWDTIFVKYVTLIDLTAAFGAGNEPTAEQMDAYLAAYPNSWFDGSALLTTSGTPNSPSPTYPAPITTITGDLSITGANGALSDTATIPLGAVELCSLPDGTKDEYDAVTGIVTKRVGKAVFDGSADESWQDMGTSVSFRWRIIVDGAIFAIAATTGQTFICDSYKTLPWASTPEPYGASSSAGFSLPTILAIRDVDVTTLADWTAHLAATPATVIYKLATPTTIQLTPDLPVVRTGIKNLTVGANITPTFTATVKAMDD